MHKRFRSIHRRYVVTQRRHTRTLIKVGKHPAFVIPLVTFFGLLLITVAAFIFSNGGSPKLHTSDSHLVIVSHDKKEQTVPTRAQTVGELLQKINVSLNEGDVVEPAADTPIQDDNFRINVYRASPVTIVDGSQKIFTYSAATTPRSVAKQVGVQVYPEDNLVSLPTENFLTEGSIGQRVVIDRATPVSINLYGTPVTVRTHAKTVGAVLSERNVKLSKDDTVEPAVNTPISAQTQIFLVRKGTQIATEQQDISPDVQTVEDNTLTFGTIAVRQQGVPGKKVITYELQMENGKEVGRKQIQEITTQVPVTQIVAKGTYVNINSDHASVMAAAGISKSDYPYVEFIVSRESGWCYTKWQGQAGDCPAPHGAPTSAGVGFGLCQSTPGYKMASSGSDWATNPVTQLKWCSGYAQSRYGGWSAAYVHWKNNGNW